MSKLFTAREVAKELRLSKPTVLRLIRRQKIKAVMVANKFLIPEEELERIKREGTEGGER